ncbi:rhodanese-like domain-containing protein [Desulfolutivibrio sp.]|uniref:rhodanese-like domain-containing protein n=1 Tax=Desulfolutivibrio sp. TaxID=2773296 RepID=UPI002F96CDC3
MPKDMPSATDQVVTRSADEVRRLLAGQPPDAVNLVDVRQDWEYREFHLPGARLVPLGELPDRFSELDREKPTVAYCRSGRRSAAAAAILAGQGFSPVINLAGGVLAWSGAGAVGPREQGVEFLPPLARPEDIFQTAYVMEVRLGAFYHAQAGQAADPELADIFRRLAGFEDKHKAMVLALWRKSGAAAPDAARLDAVLSESPSGAALEGGFSGEAYLSGRGGAPEDRRDVLELAMAVEAQAQDLYVRCARAALSEDSREALLRLSREEKGHLAALSALLDRMSQQNEP